MMYMHQKAKNDSDFLPSLTFGYLEGAWATLIRALHHFSLSSKNSSIYTRLLDKSTKGSCRLFAWLFQSKKTWINRVFDPFLEEVISFSNQVDLGLLWNHRNFLEQMANYKYRWKKFCLTCVHPNLSSTVKIWLNKIKHNIYWIIKGKWSNRKLIVEV